MHYQPKCKLIFYQPFDLHVVNVAIQNYYIGGLLLNIIEELLSG